MSPSSSGSDLDEVDIACLVADPSQVAEARRLAGGLAAKCGLDETQSGKLSIIVTEAATNLLKHAGGGAILLRGVRCGATAQIDLLAIDKGPGMRDPERCLRDGFSTAGSPGTGLGAIRRLSQQFDLFTSASGSALLARITTRATTPAACGKAWTSGAVCIPRSGEPICGDAWAVENTGSHQLLLIADGLGHGPIAAAASHEAVRIFRSSSNLEPGAIVQRIHDALRSTRGAAVAVAKIDPALRQVRFVGVGNISASIVTGEQSRSMVSHNGTAGVETRRIQEFTYPLPEGSIVIVHSDGIATHWRLSAYPGLASRDPSLIAGLLYHHFQRGRDDATVVVLSEASADSS